MYDQRVNFATSFWPAFLDGLTMAGLFRRLAIPGVPINLAPEHFRDLSDNQAVALARLARDANRRQATLALLGLICGSIMFLLCISSFVYLVVHNHTMAAYFVLGIVLLGPIARIVMVRTRNGA